MQVAERQTFVTKFNQMEILIRGMTWTEQKPKGTTFKVQSIAIGNPLNIDLIHQ